MAKYAGKKAKNPKDQQILDFLKGFADTAIKQHSVEALAEATDLSPASVNHMRLYAKGSAATWIRLFSFVYGVPVGGLAAIARKAQGSQALTPGGSTLDALIAEAREIYSENELLAWLQLLIARSKIERELNLTKGRQIRTKKKR